MDLSVIVVSYNTKKLTLECIISIKREGSKLKKEVIVIDNGSSDNSVIAISKLKSPQPRQAKPGTVRYPAKRSGQNSKLDLKIIENTSNLGFSRANNQGIKIAKGRYVLLLNSDTKVKKGAFKKLIDFAESKKQAGVVGARLLNSDGTLQGSCFLFPTLKNAVLEYFLGKKGLFNKFAPKGKIPVQVEALVGAAFLITPKALKGVGLLDERYFFYMEDIDYCRSVRKAGLKVYYLPTAEVFHFHGASGKHITGPKNQWRRQIPSSKIYHGPFKHYLLTFILWSGQKWQKIIRS